MKGEPMKRLFRYCSATLLSFVVLNSSKAFAVPESAAAESSFGFWSSLYKLQGIEFLSLPIIMFFFYFLAWLIIGQEEFSDTIIPVFSPPKNIVGTQGEIDPGSVRYAVQRELDPSCFEANLVDLAIQGYIFIEEESATFGEDEDKISFVSRTEKIISDELPAAEASLLERLFCKDSKVLLLEDSLLSSQAFSGSESDMREFGDKVFTLNREYWILCTAFLLLFPVLGYMNNMAMRFVLSIAVLIYIYYSKLDRILKRWSYSLSFKIRRFVWPFLISHPLLQFIYDSPLFIIRLFFLPWGAILLFLGAFLFNGIYLSWTFLIFLSISGIACYLFVFFLRILLPKYTKEGRKLIAAAEGLKLYMTTTDKSKIEYLNPPEDTSLVFERLFPWANAFGIAETWKDRFKNILENENYNPSWYSGDKNRNILLYGNIAKTRIKKTKKRASTSNSSRKKKKKTV
jgi:hypothetical protein